MQYSPGSLAFTCAIVSTRHRRTVRILLKIEGVGKTFSFVCDFRIAGQQIVMNITIDDIVIYNLSKFETKKVHVTKLDAEKLKLSLELEFEIPLLEVGKNIWTIKISMKLFTCTNFIEKCRALVFTALMEQFQILLAQIVCMALEILMLD